jgi:signal transduction histidine kinase
MTRFARPRLTPTSWPRLPRRTARLRLTLLCGALFLLSGATLLTVTYVLFAQSSHHSGSEHGQISQRPTPGSGPPGAISGEMHGSVSHVQQAAATAQSLADQHNLLIDFAIALAIVAVLAVLLGWFVAGRMLRPVQTITATARRISASNLHERLALDDADEEFQQLGDTLDDLFARLEAAFEAQQHFVANASHELRTPLTAERTLLQVALDDPDTSNETWRSTVREALASNAEQERLIDALLTLASSEGGLDHQERLDLSVICDDVLLRAGLDTDTLGLHVETAFRSAPLEGDPRLIERLVANLVDNAVGHNVIGGQIQVSTTVIDGKAVVSVTNTGAVIPPAEIGRLFQPFQRLDPHRTHHNDGHGLGLSIVRAIAGAHGATINARPEPEGGLRVDVTFPPQNANGEIPQITATRSAGRRAPSQSVESRGTPVFVRTRKAER